MSELEDLLRALAPQVLGALVRRYGHFDTAEDAVQEGLLAASEQWPAAGLPDRPKAWLITVASRRLTDLLRADQARRNREVSWALSTSPPASTEDDTLTLLFLCCHPSLTPSSQVALTLRAVGGLGTGQIARAFLVPEATMTRRISRAKQAIAESGIPFRLPATADRDARLTAVLHTLYLIFTEGYATTAGPSLSRSDLSAEAIRLTRLLACLLPGDAAVLGLLALELLTDARREARARPDGVPVPMDEQDRSLWDQDKIAEGVALVTRALLAGDPGPYQLQAAIAAVHDEAVTGPETDWPQIVALYQKLIELSDNPVTRLNHAVAVAQVRGPAAGLELAEAVAGRLAADHRLHAVRARLYEQAGDLPAARAAYQRAARLTMSLPRQRYLNEQAARLNHP